MRCQQCGKELTGVAKFCDQCGTPVPEPQPAPVSFEGVAVRSQIQQIGTINITGMPIEGYTALTHQLGQLLERLGVPDHVSPGSAAPLSAEAFEAAEVVGQKVEEAGRRYGAPVGDARLYLRLGNVAYDGKRYQQAEKYYDDGLTLEPDNAGLWNGRGAALWNLGRNEEALASYDRASALRPDFPVYLNNRGNALWKLGQNEEALASQDRAIALSPDYAGAWSSRGNALDALGREEEALESYDRALALSPDEAGLPRSLVQQGQCPLEIGAKRGSADQPRQSDCLESGFRRSLEQ